MPTYYSPSGNPEVWEEGKQPNGYMTPDEWMKSHPAPEPEPLTEEQLFQNLRMIRDSKLQETDKYLSIADFPLSDELREKYKAYRQELRDLPSLDGAPWDGGGENTPWPKEPE